MTGVGPSVAVMHVEVYGHSSSSSPLRERKAVSQTIVCVVCAGPDSDSSKIRSMRGEDGLEFCRGRSRVMVCDALVFQVHQR